MCDLLCEMALKEGREGEGEGGGKKGGHGRKESFSANVNAVVELVWITITKTKSPLSVQCPGKILSSLKQQKSSWQPKYWKGAKSLY